jgi:hypothetical protein
MIAGTPAKSGVNFPEPSEETGKIVAIQSAEV